MEWVDIGKKHGGEGGAVEVHVEPAAHHGRPPGGPQVGEHALLHPVDALPHRIQLAGEAPAAPAILDQKNCMYEKKGGALMHNQPFEVRNDDPTMHMLYAQLLRTLDVGISSAMDGAQALNLLDAQEIHLVITDLSMPNIDGSDLLGRMEGHQIKKTSRLRALHSW